MIFAYLTHDEVNLWAGTRLARAFDIELDGRSWREGPASWNHDAVIIDLESLPENEQRKLLAQLGERPLRIPVAVHGYDVSLERQCELFASGVYVSKNLDEATMLSLLNAVDDIRRALDEHDSNVST
jgi:hypothetical protein